MALTLLCVGCSSSGTSDYVVDSSSHVAVDAATTCDRTALEREVARGLDPNQPAPTYSIVFIAAAGQLGLLGDCVEAVRYLISIGGEVGGVQVAEQVFRRGDDTQERIDYSTTSLMLAARMQQDPAVIRLLVDNGADPCWQLPPEVAAYEDAAGIIEVAEANAPPAVVDALREAVAEHC
mgnify:CR=1 FL=1